MVGVAAVAFVLFLICRLEWDPPTAQGIGHTSVPLHFVVRDANTGEPIEAASIRLEDPDLAAEVPRTPYALDLKTGRDGQAAFVLEADVVMLLRSSPRWEYHVRYPPWQMRIVAEGHAEFVGSFRNYEAERGGGIGFHKGGLPPPSPPIVVRLRRRTQPESSKRASSR